jgi:hypothetical protein|uniref:Uncharacterized protein n=1 Tax=Eutreptiella gymnastica TaxID=73025 RepID=A0A7S4G5L5_9EUGL|eukprot:CAMPEP_0174285808 /NCGR_PEP_ID=MMETSP0809-20121228/9727_1 /TAXON_ID=73025 ORGANISM="Eutreptiella gymnastica-like, Strain CCMP1594" /NCGR_SAMPLE_ID=MMETSP0809 /ASSEMBLY_ACC=CAM_ASM_000658 /LENGTH=311 /DNA_ID=CAMNT_0015381677 /DNA_START=35 /DNA_END=970 /DNA_ORIENTATION=+
MALYTPEMTLVDTILHQHCAIVHTQADARWLRVKNSDGTFVGKPIVVDPRLAPIPGMILDSKFAIVPTQADASKLDAMTAGPPSTYMGKPIRVSPQLKAEVSRPSTPASQTPFFNNCFAIVGTLADAERLRAMDGFRGKPIAVDPAVAPLPGMIVVSSAAIVLTDTDAKQLNVMDNGPLGTYMGRPIVVAPELVVGAAPGLASTATGGSSGASPSPSPSVTAMPYSSNSGTESFDGRSDTPSDDAGSSSVASISESSSASGLPTSGPADVPNASHNKKWLRRFSVPKSVLARKRGDGNRAPPGRVVQGNMA